jgi:hypothetical protein
MVNTMASAWLSEWQKQRVMNDYPAQSQPIQVPFGNGVVLIRCVQQYIPR